MGRDTDADTARTASGLPRPGERDLLGAFALPSFLGQRIRGKKSRRGLLDRVFTCTTEVPIDGWHIAQQAEQGIGGRIL